MTDLTAPQAAAALALARAHGHLWGHLDAPVLDTAAIAAAAAALDTGVCGGILAPTVSAAGDVVHVTGSGRVTWRIAPSGETTITIARPDGPCIVAEVRGSVAAGTVCHVLADRPEAVRARHVWALEACVLALGCTEAEVARLWRRYPDAAAEAAAIEVAA